MASRTLAAADRFPAGASVSAYLMSNWLQSQLPAAGAPQGASVVTAVVAADGSVVLGGLAEDTRYLAYALVAGEHRYVSFSTLRPRSTGVASGVTFSPAGTVAATDVQAAIEEVAAEAGGGGADASSTVKGITKLSLNPVVAANPVAVGDNDLRVTADQIAAQASSRTLGSGAQQAAGGTHTHTVPDAGAAAKGVTLLSVAPAAPTSPIAVGDNDPRIAAAGRGGSRMKVGLMYQNGNGANGVKTSSISDARGAHIEIGRACTLDRIGAEVTTIATAGGALAFCIGDEDGNVLLDTGTVGDTTTLGVKLFTINLAVPAGIYWLYVVPRVAAAGLRSTGMRGSEPRSTFVNANGGLTVTGAFPNPIAVPASVAVDVAYMVILRASA